MQATRSQREEQGGKYHELPGLISKFWSKFPKFGRFLATNSLAEASADGMMRLCKKLKQHSDSMSIGTVVASKIIAPRRDVEPYLDKRKKNLSQVTAIQLRATNLRITRKINPDPTAISSGRNSRETDRVGISDIPATHEANTITLTPNVPYSASDHPISSTEWTTRDANPFAAVKPRM